MGRNIVNVADMCHMTFEVLCAAVQLRIIGEGASEVLMRTIRAVIYTSKCPMLILAEGHETDKAEAG
jgi:hypothetical protein